MNPCTFDELKTRPGPPLNAWGLYADPELGRLHMITPESVKRGRDAIKHGISVSLNLPLMTFPSLSEARPPLKREIIHRVFCLDDTVTFNTQVSTQWDGLRHFPYKDYPEKGQYLYYDGQTTEEAMDESNIKYGVQNFNRHPITSRAHLLDIPAYLSSHSLPPLSIFDTSTPITIDILEGCASAAGITFAPGDIAIVRTGFTEAFVGLSDTERAAVLAQQKVKRGITGVDASEAVMRWHWDNGLAAVATDTFAYEAYPSAHYPSIHEVFLAGWGMPLGELFDLRELARVCAEKQQWTFFFTSMGLNLDGGIGTPANAQAIL